MSTKDRFPVQHDSHWVSDVVVGAIGMLTLFGIILVVIARSV